MEGKTMKNSRQGGFVLVHVLILSLILILVSVGVTFITQIGFFSIAAEKRYQIAEKRANIGLMTVLANGNCSDYTEEGINVKAVKDVGYNMCFVWSQGTYFGAKVVKIGMFPLKGSNWAAAMFRHLNNLSGLGGSSAIIGYDNPENSCDDPNSCIAPALVTGNQLNPQNIVIACYTNQNNLGQGLVSIVNPYKYDPILQTQDLTSKIFNAENRTEMLNNFSTIFQVNFNNGTPVGLINNNDVLSISANECTTINNDTITCGNGTINFKWTETCYQFGSNCISKLDLGPNAKLTFDGSFSGGGYIAANQIIFSQKANVKTNSPLVLVARNQISATQNDINVSNVFMFSQNYDLSGKKLTITNSLIYSGGAGVGDLNINLNSDSKLGDETSSVLIISDNNINITRNGNAEIWGIIFTTEANNDFNIGSGNGNFKIHGAVISNSLNNNNLNISGNFEIRFNFKAIERLFQAFQNLGFNVLKPPSCGASGLRNFYLFTTIKIY